MRTVISLLQNAVRDFGDMPFLGQKVADSYSTTSYIETDALSTALAAALVLEGFKKGDNIAILSEGRSSWVIGEFGLLKAGCTSVPLSTKLTVEEIVFRLDHSESEAILVSENNFPKIVEALQTTKKKTRVICISDRTGSFDEAIKAAGLKMGKALFFYDDLIAQGRSALEGKDGSELKARLAAIEEGIQEDDTVTICYTSGTTGNPKGIMLTHLNYWHNSHDSAKIVQVEKGWKSLIMLPLDHSFAHTVGIYIFLLRGLCMYFVDARGGSLSALRNLPKNLVETNSDFLLCGPASPATS
ncbi:hypothetical protein MASR2M78_30140 [Treponema sp.]